MMVRLVFFFCMIGIACTGIGQSSGIGLALEGGINRGDMNYGHEFLERWLPVEDYQSLSTGGEPGRAFNLGIRSEIPLYRQMFITAGVFFTEYRYLVEGEVSRLRPGVNRPPSPDIIQSTTGHLDYRFMEFQAGISYQSGADVMSGFFGTFYLSYLIHRKQSLELDVIYETGDEGKLTPDLGMEEFDDLWMLGADIGFRAALLPWLSIGPRLSFQYGLNPLSPTTIPPISSAASLQLVTRL